MVQSRKNSTSGFFSYADSFSYNAAGSVTSMQLGNGKWESTTFNSRLQPTQIALGTLQNGTDKLKLDYAFGTTNNNGNVLSQTITVPGMTYTLVQTYAYDSLNRLDDANETSNGGQTWRQDYEFDRYGNRNFNAGNTTTLGSCPAAQCNPTISTTRNRITSAAWLYDDAGNTIRDSQYQTFTYDAENKQTEVKNSSSYTLGKYWYDGDGRRVKKEVPGTGETTNFIYNAAGQLVAEYSSVVVPVQDAMVAYLTNDHLGTPRINTDQNGLVTARHDYHPYGEEVVLTSQRTETLKYKSDTVRKQFTGYERDDETLLNYAQARYQNETLGRFNSPDPYNPFAGGSADEMGRRSFLSQPQYWNRYVYAANNPLKFVDRDGRHPAAAIIIALIVRAAVGAAAGAAVSAAIETAKQVYLYGEVVNPTVKAAAMDGAIFGAFIGAAGPVGYYIGAPIRAAIVAGANGGITGGEVRRSFEGKETTTGDVLTDALSGAAGAGAGSVVGRFTSPKYSYPAISGNLERRFGDEAVYRTFNRTANSLFVPRSLTNHLFDSQMGLRWLSFGSSIPATAARGATKTAVEQAVKLKNACTESKTAGGKTLRECFRILD